MNTTINAVELTVDQAWFIAETVGAGSFPWVLALTMPYTEESQRGPFGDRQRAELADLGLWTADGKQSGQVNPVVAEWVRLVCFPDRWLDLRFVRPAASGSDASLLRGVVAQRVAADGGAATTVVALRSAGLITFTALDVSDPRALVPVLGVGLSQREPARFDEFRLPTRVGARADERLRTGTPLPEVLDFLGITDSARPVVESVFTGPRSYVEVVAGCRGDGRETTTEVGLSVVDTAQGRILVSPSRAFDGEWVSTFSSGTPFAIALAVESLTSSLPCGPWFGGRSLARDFTAETAATG